MVSIIVPIYNVEKYLKYCINSLINQTYANIEILLIDDGSTDKCGEICDSYTDFRITVFHTKDADILCFCKYEGTYSGIEAMSAMINEKINVTTWDKLYRKECFSKIHFPEDRIIEDVDTTYKLLHFSEIVKCVSIDGYRHVYRENSISDTHSMKNLIDCWLSMVECNFSS